MKTLAQGLLLACVVGGIAGCGTSPLQACKDQGAAECKKAWSCNAPVKLGTDEADCISTYDTLCKIVQDGKCPSGQAVDVNKVVACTADLEAASCDQIKSGSFSSANCTAAKCP